MKQQTKIILAVACCLLTLTGFAQKNKVTGPHWISDKGFWVVESNTSNPLNHVVRFYSNDETLIYSEKLTGVKLNLRKRKVKMNLKKVLEAAVLAWEQHRQPEENKNYVLMVLK